MTVQPPGNFDFDAAAFANVAQSVSLINDQGSVAGGGQYSSATVPINNPSFEVFISLEFASVPTLPFVQVFFLWSDSASLDTIYDEEFWLAVPSTSFAFPTKIGRAKGNQLTVHVTNNDPAVAVNYQVVVNGISRDYPDTPWQYSLGTAPAGFTNVNSDPEMGVLASSQPSVTVATPVARLMPAYWGMVEFSFIPPAGGTGILALTPQANLGFTINPLAPIVASVAGQGVSAVRALPNCPVLLTVTNTGSATGTFTICGILQRYMP